MRTAFRSLLVAAVSAPLLAAAAPSKSFRITSYKELDEGEAKSVLLSSLGDASPGLGTTRLEVSEASVYCSALAPDGTIYLGTGDQGAVYRYRGGKLEKHAKLDSLMVATLAVGADGTIYAGTVGSGKVFAIDAKGASRELVTLEADHVWTLAVDDKARTLYAATGASGKLFAVDLATSKAKLVYDFADKHLMSLLRAEDGSLFVGSSEQALVWRLWPGTTPLRVETVHDFEGDEVRAIYRADKSLYVAVNEFTKSGGSSSLPVPPPTKGGTKISAGGTSAQAAAATPSMVQRDRKGKGAVYRIDDDGRTEQLLSTSDGYFTSLTGGPGGVYATSGANGKVYLLKPDRSVQTAIDVPERQALTLLFAKDEAVLGTGDAAALYRVSTSPKDPTYTTKVFDAQYAARWGQLRSTGRGALRIETRSGNATKPDKTWSAWTALGPATKLAHGSTAKIASPSARYVQARVVFGSKDAVLSDLTLFYAPQNQRPRVVEVTLSEEARKPLGVKPGRPHSTTLKLKWKVENPDDDELVYRLQVREENEATWKPLGGPDPLTKNEYEWNTESVADGHYLVQVTASDERANGEDETLTSVQTSDPILVDNKKPELSGVTIKYPQVTGTARDSFSPLTELSYSLDGGDWQPVAAKDGVFDDTTEEFSFKLKAGLARGTHTVAVRAVDSADNIGVSQVSFQIP